jgi:hypothetical protein
VIDTGNWISVGDLAEGFARESNILLPSHDLAGTALDLVFEDGTTWAASIALEGDRQFISLPNGPRAEVRVTSLREALYFVDYVAEGKSVTVIADLAAGVALQREGRLPAAEEASVSLLARAKARLPLTAVKASFRQARLAGTHGAFGFPRTSELVGKRIRYRYSPTEMYEHIYLNDSAYTWHCLSGVEAGLADTDLCHYFKLREELYLFVWQEKIVPTLGVITVDLARGKTDGKIFGNTGFMDENVSNFAVGALASFVNFTPPLAQA